MRADFMTFSQSTSPYLVSTTLLNFTDPDYTTITSLTGGGLTLTYDTPIDERTVPDSWNTWNTPPAVESTTPRVGTTDGVSTLTIHFSDALKVFGLEIEPDNYGPELIRAKYYSGSKLVGAINLSPNGNGGALLYAASTGSGSFTKVVITNVTGDDFAFGSQRFQLASASSTPEPGTFALGAGALLIAGFAKRRASRKS